MATPRLSKLELRIMEALWTHGPCSVRQVQEAFPEKERPAYTTVQTMVYRLEGKNAVRRLRKIGNALVFEASISQGAAHRRAIDDLMNLFDGQSQPVMAHLIETGRLTAEDIDEARRLLRRLSRKEPQR